MVRPLCLPMEQITTSNQPEFISINDVMIRYKVSRPTVEARIKCGLLTKHKRLRSNRVLLNPSEVASIFEPQSNPTW